VGVSGALACCCTRGRCGEVRDLGRKWQLLAALGKFKSPKEVSRGDEGVITLNDASYETLHAVPR
jgi:hypothetical protein